MNNKNCIFCKIVNGTFDSAKIWEDEKYIACLDIMPNTKGMTLVIPKKHHDSYVFDMSEKEYSDYMMVVKKVVKILEKGLKVNRVAMVMEGMGVNHAHIKLYPLHGVTKEFKEMWASEKKYFEKYEGYISTHTGPKRDINELKKLAEEIRNGQ